MAWFVSRIVMWQRLRFTHWCRWDERGAVKIIFFFPLLCFLCCIFVKLFNAVHWCPGRLFRFGLNFFLIFPKYLYKVCFFLFFVFILFPKKSLGLEQNNCTKSYKQKNPITGIQLYPWKLHVISIVLVTLFIYVWYPIRPHEGGVVQHS